MPKASYVSKNGPRSPFVMLLGAVLGCGVQLQQAELWSLQGYLGLPAMVAVVVLALWPFFLSHAARQAREVAATFAAALGWLLLAATLGFCLTGLRGLAFQATALDPALEGRDIWVSGVVSDLPRAMDAGVRLRLVVESASLDQQTVRLPPLLDVGWYGGTFALEGGMVDLQRQAQPVVAGERWSLLLRVKAPHGSSNPHGFDYERWLWEQGVQATAYVRAGPRDAAPHNSGQTWRYPIALARQQVRQAIERAVQPPAMAGLLAALVVGDQNAIERSDWDVFRATGVAHLVSISGLHITMFAWAMGALASWLWRRAPGLCLRLPAGDAGRWAGVLLACGYAVFSGWGVPAQRTCAMLLTVALLRAAGVRWPWPQVWMLALAVVVALDPWALLQAGFWLSFVAVGILFATDANALPHSSQAAAGARRAWPYARRAWPYARRALREQWVLTVALAPLGVLLFGQISLVGLLANAVAIPVVTLLVTPLALAGVLVPLGWTAAAVCMSWLMVWLQWLAAWPAAVWSLATPPVVLAAVAVLGALLLLQRLPLYARLLGLPLLLPVLLWQAPRPAHGEFSLLAADVGQGNAILVQTARHALLFDAGPRYSLESDAGHRVLVPLLQALQVPLDTLLLSHRDTDHTGGAAAVLAMQPQARLLSSLDASHPLQALRPGQRCQAGLAWQWDGVVFSILHPQPGDYQPGARPNALSCVLRIAASTDATGANGNGANGNGAVALLVGDIEAAQEQALVASWGPGSAHSTHAPHALRADVLLVPHHGSKTSSTEAFLDAVQPRFAWVQAGYRNRFGHPAAPVVQRYLQRGIVVRDSPHCGAMKWTSGLPQEMMCTRETQKRYWTHAPP